MLQRIKINSFTREELDRDQKATISIDKTQLIYVLQCIILFAIPVCAIALSIASDFLFLEEILSAAFLIILVLFIKVAGGRS